MTSQIVQETGINPFYLIFLMALLGLAPLFFTMVTAYIKVIVVTYLIRNALGIQQIPPTTVLAGLAMILSIFILAPVGVEAYHIFLSLPTSPDMGLPEILQTALTTAEPLHEFLMANTEEKILHTFVDTAHNIWPVEMHGAFANDSFIFLIPSYVISELTKAFEIGFLLYLPFIAIDLIISNILLAMGMMMVSPMTISLPFKLMLFVSLEGWLKLTQGLMYSYTYV